jgi:hypothetical protein
MDKYGIKPEKLYEAEQSQVDILISELCEHTEQLFSEGKNLLPLVKSYRLRLELMLIIEGGKRILQKSQKLKSKLLSLRPKLSKIDFPIILFGALFKH